jgi:hypothetical protein
MRRGLICAAAGIVLAANAWVLVSVSRNRSHDPGGSLELTERELALPERIGESTALFLQVEWDTLPAGAQGQRPPAWLDAPKLTELGFDCSVPVTHPGAQDHYRRMTAAWFFLVLEYAGPAWKQAAADRESATRLFVVDAGRDPRRLREKYPDTARHAIARGVVSPFLREAAVAEGKPAEPPRLQAWVAELLPGQVFVPSPYNRTLEGLRPQGASGRRPRGAEPRFAVTVSWGANYEPWVSGVRLLPAGSR